VHTTEECKAPFTLSQPITGAAEEMAKPSKDDNFRICPDCAAEWMQEWHQGNSIKKLREKRKQRFETHMEELTLQVQPPAGVDPDNPEYKNAKRAPAIRQAIIQILATTKQYLPTK